mmetsp:Transcript_13507/g.19684  ORF Transcript_13507/g.19684 Transcript_13507/m.19684 type:complete len:109 (+) Transcript_13507:133-459(+)
MNASINLTKHLLTQTTSPNKFLKLASCIRNAHTLIQVGSNPLEVLRSTSEKRNLCDVEGKRRPGAYWVFGMSSNGMDDGVVCFCFVCIRVCTIVCIPTSKRVCGMMFA